MGPWGGATHLQRRRPEAGWGGVPPATPKLLDHGGQEGLQSNCRETKALIQARRGISGFCFHSVRSNPYLGVGARQSPGQPTVRGGAPREAFHSPYGHNPRPFPFLEILGEVHRKQAEKTSVRLLRCPIYSLLGKTHLSQKAISSAISPN